MPVDSLFSSVKSNVVLVPPFLLLLLRLQGSQWRHSRSPQGPSH